METKSTFYACVRKPDPEVPEDRNPKQQAADTRAYFDHFVSGVEWGGITYDGNAGVPYFSRRCVIELELVLNPGDHLAFARFGDQFSDARDLDFALKHYAEKGVTVHFVDLRCNTGERRGRCVAAAASEFAKIDSNIRTQRMDEGRELTAMMGTRQRKKTGRIVPTGEWAREPLPEVPERSVLPKGKIFEYIRDADDWCMEPMADQQREAIEEYILQKLSEPEYANVQSQSGFTDVGLDAYLRSFGERPHGYRTLRFLSPGDHVVAYRADRVSSSIVDFVNLCYAIGEKGAYLHVVDENFSTADPMWRWALPVFGILRNIRTEHLSREARRRHIIAAHNNVLHSKAVPFGYKVVRMANYGKRVVPDKHHMAIIRLASHHYRQRGWGWAQIWRSIAETLKNRTHTQKKRNSGHPSGYRFILPNEKYRYRRDKSEKELRKAVVAYWEKEEKEKREQKWREQIA